MNPDYDRVRALVAGNSHEDEILERWEHPADYGGFSPDGAFLAAGVHRDSDALERANYDAIRRDLVAKAEELLGVAVEPAAEEEATIIEWEAGHWAVGWVRHLCVGADAPEQLVDYLREIRAALDDYPVHDEELFSEYENEECQSSWENLDTRERINLLAELSISIFAARREDWPGDIDDTGGLQEHLRGF